MKVLMPGLAVELLAVMVALAPLRAVRAAHNLLRVRVGLGQPLPGHCKVETALVPAMEAAAVVVVVVTGVGALVLATTPALLVAAALATLTRRMSAAVS